jgi:hypothetical protein
MHIEKASLYADFCIALFSEGCIGGPDRDRTGDLFHAIDPTLGISITYKTPVAP